MYLKTHILYLAYPSLATRIFVARAKGLRSLTDSSSTYSMLRRSCRLKTIINNYYQSQYALK